MQFDTKTLFIPFTEDLRELLEGVGITHLVSEGFLIDYPTIMNMVEMDLDPKNTFFLTPNIFFLVSGEKEPDKVDYSLISLTETQIGYSIDCKRLQDMFHPDKDVKFYIFFNEHYAPYLTRGLQYLKTGEKFTEKLDKI